MKIPHIKTPVRFGIFGAGQLARMMALDGARLGFQMHVYSPNAQDPAGQVTGFHDTGDMTDSQKLIAFLSKVDVATFESEFMDASLLQKIANQTRVPIYPNPVLMETLQDRLTQKQLLDQYKIPTAEWISVKDPDGFEQAQIRFKDGFVLKKRRFGYDGKGTFVIRNQRQKQDRPGPDLHDRFGYIAETIVPFRRELATSLFQNKRGETAVFPLVETYQEESRCLWVKGPMDHPQWPRLRRKLLHLVEDIGLQGTLAFELFDAGGDLLVNEVAPRVHNSAHYSQDAMNYSQFEMHLRCGLDGPLPKPRVRGSFAMWNIIGTGRQPVRTVLPVDATLHLYGKLDNSIGRKMGHINAVAKTPNAALQCVRRWRKEIEI